MTKDINVFVYGTLRSAGCNAASEFVDADVIGSAQAEGVIYNLGWYPGFKMESNIIGESLVQGELIRIDQEGLERLDAYEGCPSLYRRELIDVRLDNGEEEPAFVYVYNGNVHPDDLIKGGDFLAEKQEFGLCE